MELKVLKNMELHSNLAPNLNPPLSTTPRVRPRVLLIEDNPLIQKIHTEFLKRMDCEVDVACDGTKAIALCSCAYDVILLDVGLPDMNGLEVCHTLRTIPHLATTPIIGITAYGKMIEAECLDAGFNEVVAKPIRPEQLIEMVTKFIHK